jgi:hypothetical protein
VDHVENYRLPKHLMEKEETARTAGPGHAYQDQELANEYSLQRGQDLFAPPPPPPAVADHIKETRDESSSREKAKRKKERQRQREEKEKRRRDREKKRAEREERRRGTGVRDMQEEGSSDDASDIGHRQHRKQRKLLQRSWSHSDRSDSR